MNGEDYIPEAEVQTETSAMMVRDKNLPPPEQPVTPAQAKVNAIAQLTMSAYQKASELKLTPEEIRGLEEEFPDEAFRPGAAGKENLIYIEHAHLRDRMNKVFGHGQWAIVPRNRWSESYKAGRDQKDAIRVYVEAMLLVRGCFVAEAVGDMSYFPHNDSQNYGDAVEGAKTAAFRRCAKELGIGLQAWKKDWCEGWWQRKRPQNGSGRQTPPPHTTPPNAAPTPQSEARRPAASADVLPQEATSDQFQRFMALFTQESRPFAVAFFKNKGWLPNTANAVLEELPLKYIPTTKKAVEALMAEIEAFSTRPEPGDEEAWRKFLMPWGKQKGNALGDLDKKYLFGLYANYTVEEEYNGQRKSDETIQKDQEFRRMLDEAGKHYGWNKD